MTLSLWVGGRWEEWVIKEICTLVQTMRRLVMSNDLLEVVSEPSGDLWFFFQNLYLEICHRHVWSQPFDVPEKEK